jgi:thioredoxin 1
MDKRKKLVIEFVLFIIVLISITAIYNYLINKDTKQPIQENTIENVKEEEIEIIEIENAEQFEKEVIGESGTVFVDFYARWCRPCKVMSPIIAEIAKEHKEVKFVKVDIDKNEELAIKYNVINIPTMLIVKNGEITKTFIGIMSKENIVKEF